MDETHAKQLLARERRQVEKEIATVEGEGPEEGDDRKEPGDQDSEGLYQDEFDAGRLDDLKERLAAVERAEERLAAGTYGLSVQSGEAIPDERLEAAPDRRAHGRGGRAQRLLSAPPAGGSAAKRRSAARPAPCAWLPRPHGPWAPPR